MILNMHPMNSMYCISIVYPLDVITSNGYTFAYTTADKLSEAEKVVNLIIDHDFDNIQDY